MKRCLLVLMMLVPLLASAGCYENGPAGTRIERREDLEYVIRDAVNDERRKNGLPPLELRGDLRQVASEHNVHMIAREQRGDSNAFDHRDGRGRMVEDRLEAANVDWAMAGENLARNRNFPDPVDEAVRGWLASPDHRRNMMNARFEETGIAVHRSISSNTYYFTQVFVLRMPE